MIKNNILESTLESIIDSAKPFLSDIRPSDWAEKRIIMPAPRPGLLKYTETPYTREIIDCFAADHPAREIAVMGAAQWGKTSSIVIPVIGFIMENAPGNIIMTVGSEDKIEEAMTKIDYMLDSTGIRSIIRPNAMRAKSQKSGDTNTKKEFPKGYLKVSAASNYKIWQQADYQYGLIDDFDRVKSSSKAAGDIRDLIEKRFTAYAKTKKILYLSSPDLEHDSNILRVYNMGDQCKFMIPCPCCNEFIELQWSVDLKESAKRDYADKGGINWKLKEDNSLQEDSVCYICQECGDPFTDVYKSDYVNKGYWKPTAIAFKPEFKSYHMNSLYSPIWMDDWKHYVYKYLECNPPAGKRIESKWHAFLSLNLGLPYKGETETPDANTLQKNVRKYEIGVIPEQLSIRDGNGGVMLLTCACDLNGTEQDARLDYEITCWSESGAVYSLLHGSIGTFIPLEGNNKTDRPKWSYDMYVSNSVWPEFDKVIDKIYNTDTGRAMKVYLTGVDTGHFTQKAYAYIDASNFKIAALKGDKEREEIKFGVDVPNFKQGKERGDLYLVQVNQIKDDLAANMKLKFNERNDTRQPAGFMNFPEPSDGLYTFSGYFEHYQAEHRIITSVDGEAKTWVWKKKSNVHQNHFWDVCVYNMVLKDICVAEVAKVMKQKIFTWPDYVKVYKELTS